MKHEILLVDDDPLLLRSLSVVLQEAGYAVRTAESGAKALKAVQEHHPDLILLDVMMPKMDGLDVCRRLRENRAKMPIVFLTALETPEDEMRGLAAGGDIYIPKTTPDELLLARLLAVFRRCEDRSEEGRLFSFGSCQIDAQTMTILKPSGQTVLLTDRELYLLRQFASHPHEVFTRDALSTWLWGRTALPDDNSLSVAIYALRKKLGSAGDRIVALRGRGYAYRP